ncbi:MAG TPA: TonB-dependent receptor plug domain-containing protein [Woeseiaceae bacterium]|nr:TonB-dependent receptor plug domain-containing protein [Woeseiaceae bacterium]
MTNRKTALLTASASATLLAISPVSFAQDDESLFDEITVTATKRAQNIYEVPIAISAFEGDKLAQQGIVDIVDIGKFVPNLNITQFSAGHTSSANPFIRGIGLQDHLITTDPGVSVYVDGVYLGRQVGQNWNLSNIERVEVLRGPQGTLYGRNSIGGAINIITKTPGTDPGARVSIEAGSRERLNGDFYVDTQLTDTIAMAFTGGFKNRGGIGNFVNLPNAGIKVGETQEIFGRIAFRYATDEVSITLAADSNDGEGGLRPYTTLIDEMPASSALRQAGYTNADVSSDPYDNNTGQASQTRVTNSASGVAITLDWNVTDSISTKLIASARTSEYRSGLDDDSLFDDFLSFPETGQANQQSFEVQVNGDFGAWDFVSGLYHFEEQGDNFQSPTTFNGFTDGIFILEQDTKSFAGYANIGYDVSDSFRLSGGARYTEDKKDVFANVGSGPFSNKHDSDEISWELAANFTLDGGMNVYGAIQNGYQSGQFPARPYCLFGGTIVGCLIPGRNITATNYEVGIKGQPFDRLQMSAAVFYTQYSDLPYQVSSTSGGGFSTENLIVDQDSVGFEWESTLLVTDNFQFHTTLGYIDVDVDEQNNVKPVAPLTPELTFSLSPELSIPLSGGASVVMRADYSYRDEMYGEPSSDPGRLTKIDDRSIVNVDIAYHSPDETWTAALYGRNVSDERYDNARLNTGDYVLQILSNDPSEFGVRFVKSF